MIQDIIATIILTLFIIVLLVVT